MLKEALPEITIDGRGRHWERFSDPCYFDMITIRCLDVPNARSFDAPMNFSFSKASDASIFWDLLPHIS